MNRTPATHREGSGCGRRGRKREDDGRSQGGCLQLRVLTKHLGQDE